MNIQVGPATIEADSLMYQDNQIGDLYPDDTVNLYGGLESLVNGELTLAEVMALALDLPAIRTGVLAAGYTLCEDEQGVDAQRLGLPGAYRAMWQEMYS